MIDSLYDHLKQNIDLKLILLIEKWFIASANGVVHSNSLLYITTGCYKEIKNAVID